MEHKNILKDYKAIQTIAILTRDSKILTRWLGKHTIEQIKELDKIIREKEIENSL